MPCNDGGWTRAEEEHERKRQLDIAIRNSPVFQQMEAMLCSASRVLERYGYDFDENPKLSVWWATHKAEDAAREQREAQERQRKAYRQGVIEAALKKPVSELTAEEKQLLKEEKFL